jgi:hypothetical protein
LLKRQVKDKDITGLFQRTTTGKMQICSVLKEISPRRRRAQVLEMWNQGVEWSPGAT